MAEGKMSKDAAEKNDLTKANGTIKESDLEKEHRKLIWSFDVAMLHQINAGRPFDQ
jgi:uncharacterized membrane protein YkoI